MLAAAARAASSGSKEREGKSGSSRGDSVGVEERAPEMEMEEPLGWAVGEAAATGDEGDGDAISALSGGGGEARVGRARLEGNELQANTIRGYRSNLIETM